MKINISIESNPAELAELLKVAQGERDVVQEALDYLEKEISNRATCHIPADHMETGTVIQGKPSREPEATEEWITHNDADPQPTPFRPIPPCMEGKVVRMKGPGVSALTGKVVRCDTQCVVVADDLRGHALVMSCDDIINVSTGQLQPWDTAPKE